MITDKEQIQYNAGKKVIEKLQTIDFPISKINSRYEVKSTLRDGSIKDVVVISLKDATIGNYFHIYVDAINLNLLYVLGPHQYIEINDFFS
ncbi:hypothetical protein ASG22_09525 [Chryseobacterium sp. Leaf405]|uniref:hypothetical protein n=1 Tax=Chryseobacterium sp. Leaf405 TaxID=1736367 RepID=UPI0006FBA342|nr:hypothetical protein [Chryseobacterium sp. Leaf405]KQT24246.1 hypothetical protein ASG22_09525 [Chryseobacterium sp. Leaf405]